MWLKYCDENCSTLRGCIKGAAHSIISGQEFIAWLEIYSTAKKFIALWAGLTSV